MGKMALESNFAYASVRDAEDECCDWISFLTSLVYGL